MLRQLGKRNDGYELFEVTSADDLEFPTFVQMLDRAWKLDYLDEVRLDLNEDVLRRMMSGSWWLAVLARASDGSPVGFELALERRLRVRDRAFHAYYASVFTVSADHRRKGLGRWILEAINQLVFEEHDAEMILSTFHEGHAGSPAVQSTFDRIGDWGVARFHQSPIWSRRLDKDPLSPRSPVPDFVQLEMTGETPNTGLRARPGGSDRHGVPDLCAIDGLLRAEFETSFALEASLSAQYLDPRNEASGLLLYEVGSEAEICLAGFNVLPIAINDKRLPPIGQLQLLLAPRCTDAQLEEVVHHMGLFLADLGCFAMSLLDMGVVPRTVLEGLGFSPTQDLITFAARGPKSTIAAFEGLQPPFFVDFT